MKQNKLRKQIFPLNQKLVIIFTGLFLLLSILLVTDNCKMNSGEDNVQEELTETQQRYVSELNSLVYPVPSIPLDTSDSELVALDYLKDVRIVGLGEATHGTREFFQMKHRIFKYLVEHLGYNAFGIEADFGESIYLDRYITSGVGDLRQLMKEKMHFWTWRTEEVFQLLEWMKNYNQGKTRDQMIRYIGFDCQFLTYQGSLLIEYLETVDPDYLETIRDLLESTGQLDTDHYKAMTETEWNQLSVQLDQLYGYISRKENRFVPVLGKEEYDIAKHLARSLVQSNSIKYCSAKGINPPSNRDRYMAENALWLANLMGNDAKVALWAHNGHVDRDPQYSSGLSMGMHLNNSLGDLYQVIGFSFAMGAFNAVETDYGGKSIGLNKCEITTEPSKNSVNYIFYNVRHNQFMFILHDMGQDSALRDWLSEIQSFLTIGATYSGNPTYYYRQQTLTDFYDIIIHYDSTNESVFLE